MRTYAAPEIGKLNATAPGVGPAVSPGLNDWSGSCHTEPELAIAASRPCAAAV